MKPWINTTIVRLVNRLVKSPRVSGQAMQSCTLGRRWRCLSSERMSKAGGVSALSSLLR